MIDTSTFPAGITPGSSVVIHNRRSRDDIRVTVRTLTRDGHGSVLSFTGVMGGVFTPDAYDFIRVRGLAYYGRPVETGTYRLHESIVYGGTVMAVLVLHNDGSWTVKPDRHVTDYVASTATAQPLSDRPLADRERVRRTVLAIVGNHPADVAVPALDVLLAGGCYIREVI